MSSTSFTRPRKNSFKTVKWRKNCRLLESPNKIKVQTHPLISTGPAHNSRLLNQQSHPSCLSPAGHVIPPLKQGVPPIPTCQAVPSAPNTLDDPFSLRRPLPAKQCLSSFPLALGRWHPQKRRCQRHLDSALIIFSPIQGLFCTRSL